MKLYKFRSLGDDDALDRVKRIFRTGKFWCSKFWELNDPMEGVFSIRVEPGTAIPWGGFFSAKNKYRICSFSGEAALRSPCMWGYYANGFKGLAIEIEMDDSTVTEIKYQDGLTINAAPSSDDTIKTILTTKLRSWALENEYRYLTDSSSKLQKIGEITGIHLGSPYPHMTENADLVRAESKSMRDYSDRAKAVIQLAHDKRIECYETYIEGGQVLSKPLSDPGKSP